MILAVVHAHVSVKTVRDIENTAQHSSVIFHSSPSEFKRCKLRTGILHDLKYPLLIIHMHEVNVNTGIDHFLDPVRHISAIQVYR